MQLHILGAILTSDAHTSPAADAVGWTDETVTPEPATLLGRLASTLERFAGAFFAEEEEEESHEF